MKCSMVVALSMCPPTFIFACEIRKPRKLLNICMLLYIVYCIMYSIRRTGTKQYHPSQMKQNCLIIHTFRIIATAMSGLSGMPFSTNA
jgi:hypothetical protein